MIGARGLGFGAALGLLGGPAGAAPPQAYAVTRVSAALAEEQVVGERRAGLACLPAGKLRWRDVAPGSTIEQRETVQDALEDAGVPVVPLGDYGGAGGAEGTLRLRGLVTAADFNLCARRWMLGDARALSGDLHLTIEWRVESRAAAGVERKHVSEVVRHVDSRAAAPLGTLYRRLLQDAAKDLAAWFVPNVTHPSSPAKAGAH